MTKVYRLCTRSLLISKTARRYDKDTILTLVGIRTGSGKHHPKCRSLHNVFINYIYKLQ